MRLHDSWQFWALLSAGFAALTAVFAKIGIDSINSDFATFVRTIVILIIGRRHRSRDGRLAGFRSDFNKKLDILDLVRPGDRIFVAVLFPGAEAVRRRRLPPIDKLSVVFIGDHRGGVSG